MLYLGSIQRPREVEITSNQTQPIEIELQEQIDQEIDKLRADLQRVDDRTFDLQGKHDQAQAAADASGDPEDQRKADQINRALVGSINRGTATSEKLQTLRHPSELERRAQDKLANQASIRRLRMAEEATTVKKPTPKDQGFPDAYLSENGKFRIGMDARAKSDLVASVVGDITAEELGNALHFFPEKEALELLEVRGWTPFLDRKREILADKAQKQEARAKERDEAARVRAAEKEAKAKEKAEAKAKADAEKAAAAAATGDGDAKPATTKKGGTSKADQQKAAREAKAEAAGK